MNRSHSSPIANDNSSRTAASRSGADVGADGSGSSSGGGGSSYMLELDNERHDLRNLALPKAASLGQLYPTIEASDNSSSSAASSSSSSTSACGAGAGDLWSAVSYHGQHHHHALAAGATATASTARRKGSNKNTDKCTQATTGQVGGRLGEELQAGLSLRQLTATCSSSHNSLGTTGTGSLASTLDELAKSISELQLNSSHSNSHSNSTGSNSCSIHHDWVVPPGSTRGHEASLQELNNSPLLGFGLPWSQPQQMPLAVPEDGLIDSTSTSTSTTRQQRASLTRNSTPQLIGFGLPDLNDRIHVGRLTPPPDVLATTLPSGAIADVGTSRHDDDGIDDKLKLQDTANTSNTSSGGGGKQHDNNNISTTSTSPGDDYLSVSLNPDGQPYLRIGPDLRVDYVGTAAITKKAIRNREPTVTLDCLMCQTNLTCLATVDYVLCVVCQTVSINTSSARTAIQNASDEHHHYEQEGNLDAATTTTKTAGIGLETQAVAALLMFGTAAEATAA